MSIGPAEDAVVLEHRLAELGVSAVHEALDMIAAWDRHAALGIVQNPAQATKAPRLKKSDGQLDWARSAEQIRNQVRALKPWPGTYTAWHNRQGGELRLILDQASVATPSPGFASQMPGEVVSVDKQHLWIATGAGVLAVDRLQPAGKRVLDVAEFLRGYPVQLGDRFGP
jgi:methionyl-tRNA formyltransferase